jgi:hypothetical protein
MTTDTSLSRAEAAYAHLASFQLGDKVDVGGRSFYQPGTVTTAQQDGDCCVNRSYLNCGRKRYAHFGPDLLCERTPIPPASRKAA